MNISSLFRASRAWVSLGMLGILGALLFWRLQLGMTRYFDIDEFAHLHWGYNFFAGAHPYKDYLYFFPPGFLFFLWPIFAVMGKTYAIFAVSRVIAFGWFVLLLLTIFLLVKEARNSMTALLTVVFLAWLPLPADKFLEMRPDTPAVAFSLLGMYFLVKKLQRSNAPISQKRRWLFLSGLSYGAGLMILPKVILFVVVGIGILMLSRSLRHLVSFGIGLLIPALITLLFFVWSGDFARALYLTTIFASESTKVLGSKFYMFPSHFFYPNDVYYGFGGVSSVLAANHLVYMIGLVAGVAGMASVLFPTGRVRNHTEMLLSGSFLINLYAFMRIVPLKHAQYLILLAPFVSFYAAGSLLRLSGKMGKMGIVLLFFLLLGGLHTAHDMYQIKRHWVNTSTYAELDAVKRAIPDDVYVWDLVGETVFYKDPYYICCIPYGQYLEAFGFVPPSLRAALEQTDTQYVFAHSTSRLSVLPDADARYISEHYETLVSEPLLLKRR